MKQWWKSTTVALGALLSLVLALLPMWIEMLNYIGNFDFDSGPINWWLFASGILMIVQRWRTDQPITSVNSSLDNLRPGIKSKASAGVYSEVANSYKK